MKPAFYFGLGSWIIFGIGCTLLCSLVCHLFLSTLGHGGGNGSLIGALLILVVFSFAFALFPAVLAHSAFSYALVRADKESRMTHRRALGLGLVSSLVVVSVTSVIGVVYATNDFGSSKTIEYTKFFAELVHVPVLMFLCAMGLLLLLSFATAYCK
jgi:phosphotransferase system  glucose/maltose/N-acetylglucosamine-specific IIC component